jgi:hypothetical protein
MVVLLDLLNKACVHGFLILCGILLESGFPIEHLWHLILQPFGDINDDLFTGFSTSGTLFGLDRQQIS